MCDRLFFTNCDSFFITKSGTVYYKLLKGESRIVGNNVKQVAGEGGNMCNYMSKGQGDLTVRFFTKIQIRILIRKRIFRFFTKIEKGIIDRNDPQRR